MITDPEDVDTVSTTVAARVLGVSTTTVRDVLKRGLVEKHPSGKQGRWDLRTIVPAYIKFRIGGKVESSKARLTEQQERKLKLANDETEGRLIKVEYASAVFAEFAATMRAGITALPGRISSQVAGMSKPNDVRKLLNEEVDDLLRTAQEKLQDFVDSGEAASLYPGWDVDPEANPKKNSGSVGGRKSSSAKRKRGARKVAK